MSKQSWQSCRFFAVAAVKKRQKTVCGRAGDKLELAAAPERAEGLDQVPVIGVKIQITHLCEAGMVMQRQPVECRHIFCPLDFLVCQRYEIFQLCTIALLKQRVGEHAQKGR